MTTPSPDTAPVLTSLPTDRELVLKVIPMPADCNANGDIFGGWVMAQVDLAGSVLPVRVVGGADCDRCGERVYFQATGSRWRSAVVLRTYLPHRTDLHQR